MEQLAICQQCGQTARVRILEGYARGEPVLKAFCMDCADRATRHGLPRNGDDARATQRLSVAAILIFAGVFIGFLGAAGDYLGIHTTRGFGWHQQMGTLVGMLFLLVGALLRVDVLAILGAMLFAAAVGADLVRITASPGLGWKQSLMMLGGVGLIATGFFLRRR